MSAPTAIYPGYPAQGYLPPPTPPTPPTPQYPAAPSYPSAPGQLPQQYAPQPGYAPQYPQAQGYPAPMMAPPAPPLVQGSIEDFYNQPSAGNGKALSFNQPGETYVGIVTRPLGQGDIEQQTNTQKTPQFFKDGRPKFVMKVPLQMQPSPTHPDGLATWYVKGAARDELVRAMAEVGAPAGPPEAGAVIQVTFTGTRQSGVGMNPAKLYAVRYQRPGGAAPAQPAAPAPVAQAPAQPAYDPAMAQAVAQVQQAFPSATEVPQQQYAPAAPLNVPPAQAAMPSQPIQPPAGLSPEQEALLAQLTAAQQG